MSSRTKITFPTTLIVIFLLLWYLQVLSWFLSILAAVGTLAFWKIYRSRQNKGSESRTTLVQNGYEASCDPDQRKTRPNSFRQPPFTPGHSPFFPTANIRKNISFDNSFGLSASISHPMSSPVPSRQRSIIGRRRNYPSHQPQFSGLGSFPGVNWRGQEVAQPALIPSHTTMLRSPVTIKIAAANRIRSPSPLLQRLQEEKVKQQSPNVSNPCSKETIMTALRSGSRKRALHKPKDTDISSSPNMAACPADAIETKRRCVESTSGSSPSNSSIHQKTADRENVARLAAKNFVSGTKRKLPAENDSVSPSYLNASGDHVQQKRFKTSRNSIVSSFSSSKRVLTRRVFQAQRKAAAAEVQVAGQTPKMAAEEAPGVETTPKRDLRDFSEEAANAGPTPHLDRRVGGEPKAAGPGKAAEGVGASPQVNRAAADVFKLRDGLERKRRIPAFSTLAGKVALPPELPHSLTDEEIEKDRKRAEERIKSMLEGLAEKPTSDKGEPKTATVRFAEPLTTTAIVPSITIQSAATTSATAPSATPPSTAPSTTSSSLIPAMGTLVPSISAPTLSSATGPPSSTAGTGPAVTFVSKPPASSQPSQAAPQAASANPLLGVSGQPAKTQPATAAGAGFFAGLRQPLTSAGATLAPSASVGASQPTAPLSSNPLLSSASTPSSGSLSGLFASTNPLLSSAAGAPNPLLPSTAVANPLLSSMAVANPLLSSTAVANPLLGSAAVTNPLLASAAGAPNPLLTSAAVTSVKPTPAASQAPRATLTSGGGLGFAPFPATGLPAPQSQPSTAPNPTTGMPSFSFGKTPVSSSAPGTGFTPVFGATTAAASMPGPTPQLLVKSEPGLPTTVTSAPSVGGQVVGAGGVSFKPAFGPTSSSASSATPSFSVGGASLGGGGQASQGVKGGFQFGGSSLAATTAAPKATTTAAAAAAPASGGFNFTFGSAAGGKPATALPTFGASAEPTKTATTANPAAADPATSNPFGTPTPASVSTGGGGMASNPFGSSSTATTTSIAAAFGASAAKSTSSAASIFGGATTMAAAPTPSIFGANSPAAFGKTTQASNTFGTSVTTTTKSSQSPFAFGGGGGVAASSSGSTTQNIFGGSSTATPFGQQPSQNALGGAKPTGTIAFGGGSGGAASSSGSTTQNIFGGSSAATPFGQQPSQNVLGGTKSTGTVAFGQQPSQNAQGGAMPTGTIAFGQQPSQNALVGAKSTGTFAFGQQPSQSASGGGDFGSVQKSAFGSAGFGSTPQNVFGAPTSTQNTFGAATGFATGGSQGLPNASSGFNFSTPAGTAQLSSGFGVTQAPQANSGGGPFAFGQSGSSSVGGSSGGFAFGGGSANASFSGTSTPQASGSSTPVFGANTSGTSTPVFGSTPNAAAYNFNPAAGAAAANPFSTPVNPGQMMASPANKRLDRLKNLRKKTSRR